MIVRESCPGDFRGIFGSCRSGRVMTFFNSPFSSLRRSVHSCERGHSALSACEGMLGQKELAEHFRVRSIEEHPDFDLEEWLSLVPMKLKADHEHFREGCRLAGFR